MSDYMYKRISKIGHGGNSEPATTVVKLVKNLKQMSPGGGLRIAEVGVDIGATAVEICKVLDKKDTYYCFDFEHVVREIVEDLMHLPGVECQLVACGNTRRIYDSYNWTLSEFFLKMLEDDSEGYFDLVYLDGAHTLFHDGLATCMLKELLKPNGYLVFDDLNWTIGRSPTVNPVKKPEMLKCYTEEQINTCQVARVVDIFMRTDKRFKEITVDGGNKTQAAFHKCRM